MKNNHTLRKLERVKRHILKLDRTMEKLRNKRDQSIKNTNTLRKRIHKITHRKWNLLNSRNHLKHEYDKSIKTISKLTEKQKQGLIDFRGGVCEDCKFAKKLQVHHIKPLLVGGSDNVNNLKVVCRKCHGEEHQLLNNLKVVCRKCHGEEHQLLNRENKKKEISK